MKKNLYIPIFALGILIVFMPGCRKSDIMTYSSGQYLQFEISVVDTTEFSFLFHPGVQSYDFPVPIEVSGAPLHSDTRYNIVVDTKYSTAVEGTHFTLPPASEMVFRAGHVRDTCYLTLLRKSEMQTTTMLIVLRIESNENFITGQRDYLVNAFKVSDKIARPAWWNSRVVSYYLGEYSDKKYQLFMDVTGKGDLTGWNDSRIRAITMDFTNYLRSEKSQGREVFEADGHTSMTTRFMDIM